MHGALPQVLVLYALFWGSVLGFVFAAVAVYARRGSQSRRRLIVTTALAAGGATLACAIVLSPGLAVIASLVILMCLAAAALVVDLRFTEDPTLAATRTVSVVGQAGGAFVVIAIIGATIGSVIASFISSA